MAQATYSLTPKGMAAAAECIHDHTPPARAPRRKCRHCAREVRERADACWREAVDRGVGWNRFYQFYQQVLIAWEDGCSCRACHIVDRSEQGAITRQEERQLLVLTFESIGAWHGDAAYSWEATSAHLDTGNVAGRHSLPPDRLLRK
jgi:hypothetical protein